jgi:hypothetical protein
MRCKQAEELFGEYLDGRLEKSLAERLEAHLRECKECASQLAALRFTLQRVKSLDAVPLPEGFVERVGAAVRQRAKERTAWNLWPAVRWLAPAFGILVIGMLAWLTTRPGGFQGQETLSERMAYKSAKSRVSGPEAERAAPTAPEMLQRPAAAPSAAAPPERETGAAPLQDRPAKAAGPRLSWETSDQPQVAPAPLPRAEEKGAAFQSLPPAPSDKAMEARPAETRGEAGPAPLRESAEEAPGLGALAESAGAAREKAAESEAAERAVSVRARAEKDRSGRPLTSLRVEAVRPMGVFSLRASAGGSERQLNWKANLFMRRSAEFPSFSSSLSTEGPTIWEISLDEEPSAERIGRRLIHEEYRLFSPSRLGARAPVTATYDEETWEAVLADLSERTGLVILVPASQGRRLFLSFKGTPAEVVMQITAEQLGCRVEADGFARNFVPE